MDFNSLLKFIVNISQIIGEYNNKHRLSMKYGISLLIIFILFFCNTPVYSQDTDGDGIENAIDLDDDNDGILDVVECNASTVSEIMGGAFPATSNDDAPISGTVTGLTYTTSHAAQNGSFIYTNVRLAEVVAAAAKATFFMGGPNADLGQIELYADQYDITTLAHSSVVSNTFIIRDFDCDIITFTIEVWNDNVKILNASDLNVSIIGGPATLSSVTDLGSGVFQYTMTYTTSGHNTHIQIASNAGDYLDKLKFQVTHNPNYSGEKLAFRSVRTIETCVDTDLDGNADYIDLDSDNDGCPDAIEGGASFVKPDLKTDLSISGSVDSDGIPVAAGSGQAVGTSIDNALQDPDCSSMSLPVELISFTAQKEGFTTILNWQTATETNNDYFEIQYSTNGVDFETIGTVYSKNGNSNYVQNYNYTHANPANGVNYYRLKQADYDGQFEYSENLVLNFERAGELKIYPNPAISEISIDMPSGHGEIKNVYIINSAGLLVKKIQEFDKNAYQNLKLQLGDIDNGLYLIQVHTDNQLYRKQFVISK